MLPYCIPALLAGFGLDLFTESRIPEAEGYAPPGRGSAVLGTVSGRRSRARPVRKLPAVSSEV